MTLLSLDGAELACMRLCINIKGAAQSTFFVSSFDGELVYADWLRPEVHSITVCFVGAADRPYVLKCRVGSLKRLWHAMHVLAVDSCVSATPPSCC